MKRFVLIAGILIAVFAAIAQNTALSAPSRGSSASYLSPTLVRVASVSGTILDVSATKVLYRDAATAPPRLKVLDRASRTTSTVPAAAGRNPDYGFLSPTGVVFVAGSNLGVTQIRVYQWSGAASLTDLGSINSRLSLRVQGRYAIWSDGPGLFRRDLVIGRNVTVSTNAGNWQNDVLPNGDVFFWTTPVGPVERYRNGVTQAVASDLGNFYIVASGNSVAFQKRPVNGPDGPYSTWLYDGTGERQLTPSSQEQNTPNGSGYDVAGGWTAFLRTDSGGQPQVWLRGPDGATTQLTHSPLLPAGKLMAVLGVDPAGEVVYQTASSVYLVVPGHARQLLAAGVGAWSPSRRAGAGNYAAYLGGQWLLAIGGTVYAKDTTAPTVSAPVSHLPAGAALSAGIPSAIPLATAWTAQDSGGAVASDELAVSTNAGGFAPVPLPAVAAATASSAAVATARYQFRVRASDSHGNVSAWRAGTPVSVTTVQQAAFTYQGS
jgi:hypothetical protein